MKPILTFTQGWEMGGEGEVGCGSQFRVLFQQLSRNGAYGKLAKTPKKVARWTTSLLAIIGSILNCREEQNYLHLQPPQSFELLLKYEIVTALFVTAT